jgi:hypothetical protein
MPMTTTQGLFAAAAATLALATGANAQAFAPFTPVDTNFNAITSSIVPASPVMSAVLIRGAVDTATTTSRTCATRCTATAAA